MKETFLDEMDQNPLGLFSLSRRTIPFIKKENIKIGRSTSSPTYSQFEEINKLFNTYSLNQLYKMELAGAKVKIKGRDFIVVEERKNSLITISKDNRVRTFIKKGLEFILEKNNVQYLFLGRGLKMNRFLKK